MIVHKVSWDSCHIETHFLKIQKWNFEHTFKASVTAVTLECNFLQITKTLSRCVHMGVLHIQFFRALLVGNCLGHWFLILATYYYGLGEL